MMRVVQIQHGKRRAVAVVEEPRLRVVGGFDSVYALAFAAMGAGAGLSALISKNVGDEAIDYDAVYGGKSDWKLMVPVDHPGGVGGTLVCGTGLTHFGSARDRQAMHVKDSAEAEENLTDSMKMFRWGVEGGRP